MYTSAEAAASNKRAALEQLRLSKRYHESSLNHPNSSLPVGPHHSPYASPPSQSRDATVPSRFFPVTPSSNGIVLVPSSSPLAPDLQPPSYRHQIERTAHDVASLPTVRAPNNAWIHSQKNRVDDPLSTPSGFVFSGTGNASFRNPMGFDSSNSSVTEQEEGPPRKRLNRGSAEDTSDSLDVLSSPEVRRGTHRRRIASGNTDIMSITSDDSLPDAHSVTSTSTSRLTKHAPTSSSSSNMVNDEAKFTRFKYTMPQESPTRVRAAWDQANGDIKKATALLCDPGWAPLPSSSAIGKIQLEAMGRVQELDEESRARRAAAKEKGKKSMIYANRSNLENKILVVSTPPSSKRPLEVIPVSPETPIIRPQRKRLKQVVKSDSEEEASAEEQNIRSHSGMSDAMRALNYLNTSDAEALQELTGCSPEQANAIITLRPFESIEALNTKLSQGKKKAGPAGISPRLFEDCTAIFEGYGAVDDILEDCEKIGASLCAAISSWTATPVSDKGKAREYAVKDEDEGSLSLRVISTCKDQRSRDFLSSQPSLLSDSVQLKEYQLLGVNWLNLLYRRNLSCILADEMGLGKTIQVISFFAHLKERGHKGPHLVVVPSSTLENWCREFARFAPSISVQTYYAGKEERPQLRQTLIDTQLCCSKSGEGWEVLITTYNLAQGDDRDRKFFRKINWDCCVYDEGHILKNFQSQRYQSLLKFGSRWRLLLTGTPLQNNLQELVSLMNFILPHHFADSLDSLRAIFKAKGDCKITLLAQERVSRAKKMMAPFVLRRRKDQVLRDLPNKTERIEWCEMTALQRSIYTDALQRSRKTIVEADQEISESVESNQTNGRTKNSKKQKANNKDKNKVYLENSANVLMDLRKAASHPMLFRAWFTDDTLSSITKQLLKEPDFKKRGAVFELVKEDMSVMTDAELQVFCATYKSTRKFLQKEDCYLDAGKVKVLLDLLTRYHDEGRKVLIFSQFTQILDILQAVLKYRQIHHLVLTGSTPVDVRQTLVDEFTEDDSIPVFLLSTKAGGMGINLTAASVVIMFDQDFNPHNDRQAQDRAYRIGQKRDVEVVKLISRGTIEEDMLRLGQTKLALDEAVAGDSDDKGESVPEREMKTSLLHILRQQLEKQEEDVDTNQAQA